MRARACVYARVHLARRVKQTTTTKSTRVFFGCETSLAQPGRPPLQRAFSHARCCLHARAPPPRPRPSRAPQPGRPTCLLADPPRALGPPHHTLKPCPTNHHDSALVGKKKRATFFFFPCSTLWALRPRPLRSGQARPRPRRGRATALAARCVGEGGLGVGGVRRGGRQMKNALALAHAAISGHPARLGRAAPGTAPDRVRRLFDRVLRDF